MSVSCQPSAALALLLLVVPPCAAQAANPDALRQIVQDICVPAATISSAPLPCRLVDPSKRYAVLKDLQGATQYLVVPTDTITGIESPGILAPNAPNFWEDAWEARRFIDQNAGRSVPRNFIGLAINSDSGRTQNQLHIHVDCIKPAAIRALRLSREAIGPAWQLLPVKFTGHPYMAMRIDAPDFSRVNPFQLLADGVPGAKNDMKDQTLVAVPATFKNGQDGFYLLTDHVDKARGDIASGEELLDHSCTLLAQ